ncbi:MAG: hypothetical protein RJA02_816, partial [Armatimonadota bacterium]
MARNGKTGIGIIGFGGIAQGAHMGNYLKQADTCEVIAIADVAEERRAQAKDKFAVEHILEDYHKLLAMPEIDAVSVCTPNGWHKQITIDALRAGKHVLCEKPMAMNASECLEMISVSKETGNKLQIGYNM